MRAKGILVVGFWAIMAATGAANASNNLADARRVDVIGNTNGMATQLDSNVPHNVYADARPVDDNELTEGMVMPLAAVERQHGRVDVIDSIRLGGARYSYTKPMSTKYTRAKIFSQVGKKTELFARFTTVAGERGAADAERDIRGFSANRQHLSRRYES